MTARVGLLLSALLILTACGTGTRPAASTRLERCAGNQGPADAYCGTLRVYENRDARAGRQIPLRIIVLPATGSTVEPDPLFFLAGGPGQGAAQMATEIRAIFRRVLRTRDIVLVDQRGTGRSNPLNCRSDSDTLQSASESEAAALDRLRACLAGLDADVRFYTTPVAMDDLDDVRAHLGYDRINLYGGSYGTRAALVYLRQHGAHVRSMILDGVAPLDMRLPLFTARDAQRALDKLLTDCEAEPSCRARFPGLAARVRALMLRLEAAPPLVRMAHPRTGVIEDVRIEPRVVASILFGALYSPVTASLVPAIVEQAERDQFQALFALGLAGESSTDNMSTGMQLSVLCSEDAPGVSEQDIAREGATTVFGAHLMRGQLAACGIWPKGDIPAAYYDPVSSDVPTLVLSGDLDPVTPPEWGESVARHLSRARHVVARGTGHGVVATSCGGRLIEQFLADGSADGLDVACAAGLERPPFFVTLAGPDPGGTAATRNTEQQARR